MNGKGQPYLRLDTNKSNVYNNKRFTQFIFPDLWTTLKLTLPFVTSWGEECGCDKPFSGYIALPPPVGRRVSAGQDP